MQIPGPRRNARGILLLGEETYCCEVQLVSLLSGCSLKGLKCLSYFFKTFLLPVPRGHYDQLQITYNPAKIFRRYASLNAYQDRYHSIFELDITKRITNISMHDDGIESVGRDQDYECVGLFQGFTSNFGPIVAGIRIIFVIPNIQACLFKGFDDMPDQWSVAV